MFPSNLLPDRWGPDQGRMVATMFFLRIWSGIMAAECGLIAHLFGVFGFDFFPVATFLKGLSDFWWHVVFIMLG